MVIGFLAHLSMYDTFLFFGLEGGVRGLSIPRYMYMRRYQ